MDCLQAQQILSEAVDREPVAPEVLAAAKAHCIACVECARFVRGLALLQRAQPPKGSPALSGRILAAIEAERAASAAPARASESGEASLLTESPQESTPEATQLQSAPMPTPASAARRRARQRSVLAWAGAAAAVLIVATFAAVAGLRSIILPERQSAGPTLGSSRSAPNKSVGTPAPEGPSYDAMQPGGSGESTGRAASMVGQAFITVNGVAYRLSGAIAISRSELTTLSTTTSALGTGRAPQVLTVFATPTTGQVALFDGAEMLAFDVVSRKLGGQAYVLRCDPITAFGVWPSLPSQFIQPTTADGAPTFIAAQTDDLGVQVFARPGTPVAEAFAVGPTTSESDPARGDPNWTWWTRSNR